MFLNLTDEPCVDLVVATENHWSGLLPHDWLVTPFRSAEANYPFNPEFVSDERGLAIGRRPFIDECPSSMKFIDRLTTPAIMEWLDEIRLLRPRASLSGTHYMDSNGFIAWHTNQLDRPQSKYRLYATFNETVGSVFKYILPGTTEVVVFEEPVGWYFKLFRVDTAMPHCVVSGSQRWSIGTHF